MFFIEVNHAYDETGQLYASRLKLAPLLSNNAASIALYGELCHRLRRDNFLRKHLHETELVFDACLYFKSCADTERSPINAVFMLNAATDANGFNLDYDQAETIITEWLERMDTLLSDLLSDKSYFAELKHIAKKFAVGNKAKASEELKGLLKKFGREEGLLVDEQDVRRERTLLKEQRRAQTPNPSQAQNPLQPAKAGVSRLGAQPG